MNPIAQQLRTNADVILGEHRGLPDAAVAGSLQMGADEIDRQATEIDRLNKEVAALTAERDRYATRLSEEVGRTGEVAVLQDMVKAKT